MPCVADMSRCYVFILLGYTRLVLPFSCLREPWTVYGTFVEVCPEHKLSPCSHLFNKKNAFRKGGEEMREKGREVGLVEKEERDP